MDANRRRVQSVEELIRVALRGSTRARRARYSERTDDLEAGASLRAPAFPLAQAGAVQAEIDAGRHALELLASVWDEVTGERRTRARRRLVRRESPKRELRLHEALANREYALIVDVLVADARVNTLLLRDLAERIGADVNVANVAAGPSHGRPTALLSELEQVTTAQSATVLALAREVDRRSASGRRA